MSAVTNIVLADAQATPVTHTFVPIGPDSKGTWWFEDQSAPSAIGFNRISLELTKPLPPGPNGVSGNQRINRVKIGLHTPKLETLGNNSAGITPPPTVSYTPRVNVEFVLPERNALQDRKDIRKFIQNLCADAMVVDMVENLRNIY